MGLPDGGATGFGYCDAGSAQGCPTGALSNSVTRTVAQNSCGINSVVTDAVYDGLGRTVTTHAYEAAGAITVQTVFDAMGRASMVSNPYRSPAAPDYTVTAYDALGRAKTVTYPSESNDNFVSTYTGPGAR